VNAPVAAQAVPCKNGALKMFFMGKSPINCCNFEILTKHRCAMEKTTIFRGILQLLAYPGFGVPLGLLNGPFVALVETG